jgi:DNA primase
MKMNKVVNYVEVGKLIDICHANLKNSDECMKYLTDTRGLSQASIEKYKLGYFPQSVNQLVRFIPEATLRDLMLIDYSGNSKFSEFFYLVFPVFSEYKEAVAIGGRTLLDDSQRSLYNLPKYKNSSYKKTHNLYGLNHSRSDIFKEQNVYVVEGFFDHIALDSNGIKNSVAICGTAFSKNHFLKLSRYTDKITFVLDRDDGGKKSMEQIYTKFCNKGIKLRFLLLPEGYKDVDQYFASGKSSTDFARDLEHFIPNW